MKMMMKMKRMASMNPPGVVQLSAGAAARLPLFIRFKAGR